MYEKIVLELKGEYLEKFNLIRIKFPELSKCGILRMTLRKFDLNNLTKNNEDLKNLVKFKELDQSSKNDESFDLSELDNSD